MMLKLFIFPSYFDIFDILSAAEAYSLLTLPEI